MAQLTQIEVNGVTYDIADLISGFVTASVNNLANYYLKSETYTRAEVQQLIAAIQGVSFVSVATLPTASADTMGGKIYLVPSSNPKTQNVKDEYITIEANGSYSWEQIGSTEASLDGYVTDAELNAALADYTTTADLTALMAGKVDKVPGKGLSTNDYTDEEKAKVGNAYVKPQTGIPASDLAEGVIPDVSGKANTSDLSQVAFSGDYDDLANKPTIPSGVVVDQTYDATSENAQSGVAMAGALAEKQDTISDLSTIRTGAAAGATAVQPEAGKGLFSGNYNDLSNKPDLSGFITKSVDDLVNYYLKSETYTKTEVQNLIAAINQFHYEIYASTSAVTDPASNVLYLIGPTGTGADKYEEYVYDSTKQDPWVKIGDTSIDLSGYVTTTALNTALADYTTTANLTTLLAGKQDKIDSTHKLDYSLVDNTPTIPDAVEANPTVPSGTTPSDLTGLKVGNDYFSIPEGGGGGGGGSDSRIVNIVETMFAIVDENLNIGAYVDATGVHAPNILEYEIVN